VKNFLLQRTTNYIKRCALLIFFVCVLILPHQISWATSLPLSGKSILIDVGHGGWDPGKVGARNTLEKDVNLAIALKLQQLLESSDAYVLMTRTEDKALGSSKKADMQGRRHLANMSSVDILVSIHQNAYASGGAKGPMVFHYSDTEHSKNLAGAIQEQMNKMLERSPKRTPKINKSYYILRATTVPAALVECGFLTNSWDLDCLKQEQYQEKVAWAIYMGIVNYFEL